MKLSLEMYGMTYTVETKENDFSASEMKEIFSRLLVQAGYELDVIDLADGGHYEIKYIAVDERCK